MTAYEFAEQMAYYDLHPWGDDWLQAGVTAAAAASSHPYRKRPPKVEQYMPRQRKRHGKSVEEMRTIMMQFANAWNRTNGNRR